MLLSRSANTTQSETPIKGKQPRTLRNSDRIQIKFGNYDIDIIENDLNIRVSSLYSVENNIKTNRTFAVVAYPEVIDAAFEAEHEAIINGQSIGIVFEQNGWAIEKHHQYFGEIEVPGHHASTHPLFGGNGTNSAAIHIYSLLVEKDNFSFEYALIAEVHHPDFLQLEDLKAVYGQEPEMTPADDGSVRSFLAIVRAKIQGL